MWGFVETLERQGPKLADLMRLTSPGRTVVVLANDLDPRVARELATGVLARDGLKLVLCLSTGRKSTPKPNFGLDERVRQLSLPPLSDDDSRKLLSAAGAKLDYSLKSWIIDNAGGVPACCWPRRILASGCAPTAASFLNRLQARSRRSCKADCLPRNRRQRARLRCFPILVYTERLARRLHWFATVWPGDQQTTERCRSSGCQRICAAGGFVRGSYPPATC